jgi:hypothetical protein
MKKNSLTTAVAAGIAGVAGLAGMANAVNVNPDGLGQVLLYPYYTVNGGNATLLSVVNTTNQGKAVKVRFLEALNSAEVLDFNLYLSPFDVWTASISTTAAGATLRTSDTSCTVPNNVGKGPAGTEFLPFEFENNSPDIIGELGQMRLGGSGSSPLTPISVAERVRQGHVEIIEMGVLLNEGSAAADFRPLAWSTHAGPATARLPNNCAALEAAWAGDGRWTANRGRAVNSPTGGLFGAGVIVDVAQGRALTYNADAIDGFWRNTGLAADVGGSQADLHREPGDTAPSLADARTEADGSATAIIFDNGNIVSANFIDGLSAVSATLMSRFIYNEFNLEAAANAASEWVITFPTKRGHTYVGGATATVPVDVRPFSDGLDIEAVAAHRDGLPFDTYGLCETIAINWWDREERTTTTPAAGTTISPRPPVDAPTFPQLCWEANILAFNQNLATADTATSVLGATPKQGAHGLDIGASFVNGWARIEFNSPLAAAGTYRNYLVSDDANPRAIVGLPVIGFWAADYVNTNVAAGVRANYSQIHKHRSDRDGFLLGANPVPAFGTPLNSAGLSTWTTS